MAQVLQKLNEGFFLRDVLMVAPELIGKYLIHTNGTEIHPYRIMETEAYRGEMDLACHACKGRTKRTEIMYHTGGHLYTYLIYGMYWMLNIVTGPADHPEAVLLRGIEGFDGPGKLTRKLGINGTYYGEHLCKSERIWIADAGDTPAFFATPRIGIDYAGEPWVSKPWRYKLKK